jgi:hypothetical protein
MPTASPDFGFPASDLNFEICLSFVIWFLWFDFGVLHSDAVLTLLPSGADRISGFWI